MVFLPGLRFQLIFLFLTPVFGHSFHLGFKLGLQQTALHLYLNSLLRDQFHSPLLARSLIFCCLQVIFDWFLDLRRKRPGMHADLAWGPRVQLLLRLL